MNSKLIFVILFSILISIILFLVYINKPPSEDYIRNEIEKANYCSSKDDCVLAGSKCPFGCHIFVNKNEKDKISDLIEGYQGTCLYACVELKDYNCIDKKCAAIY